MALSPDQRKTEQKGGWAAQVAKSPEGSMIAAGPHKHCLLGLLFIITWDVETEAL